MIYVGVDPGLTGAVAFVSDKGDCWVIDVPVLAKRVDVAALADELRSANDIAPLRATVEYAKAMPGMGVSSIFNFGQVYGALVAALAMCRIPTEFVTPAKWRPAMVGKGADKDVSRAKALQIFPSLSEDLKRKKDHNRAEALLIAEYGRRTVWGACLSREVSSKRGV